MDVLLTGDAEHARDALVFETAYEQVGDTSSVFSHTGIVPKGDGVPSFDRANNLDIRGGHLRGSTRTLQGAKTEARRASASRLWSGRRASRHEGRDEGRLKERLAGRLEGTVR